MTARRFKVQKFICLGYGSHVHCLTPPRWRRHAEGSVLVLDVEAPNGTVWFIDSDGERGKIDCGCVNNLIKDGRIVEL